MARVVVRPEQLRSVARQIKSRCFELRGTGTRLQSGVSGIDIHDQLVRSTSDPRAEACGRRARALADQAEELARHLEETASAFEQLDRDGRDLLQGNHWQRHTAQMRMHLRRAEQWNERGDGPAELVEPLLNLGSLLGFSVATGPLFVLMQLARVDHVLRKRTGQPPNPALVKVAQGVIGLGLFLASGRSKVISGYQGPVEGMRIAHVEAEGASITANVVRYKTQGAVKGVPVQGSVSLGNANVSFELTKAEASLSAVHAKGEAQIYGDEDVNISATGEAKVGSAKAEYNLDWRKGTIGAEAHLAAVEGEAGFKLKIFSFEVKLGVSACAACAGAAAKIGSGEGQVKLAGLVGLGFNWKIEKAGKTSSKTRSF